jgi:hypothetical protein
MSNKTISINPSLFSINSSKTKKNRQQKTKQTNIPIISPSVLKNKLLKRIKEHKTRENNNLEPSKKEETNKKTTEFNDEFNDSINYLQTLSKEKKYNEEKQKNEIIKQKSKEQIEKKTIKNHNFYSEQAEINPYQLDISLELPEELQVQQQIYEPIKINTQKQNDIPYGILKGGLKPTYREWNRTQRNNIVNNPNSSLIIQESKINTEKSAREKRLNLLKEKIKQKQEEKSNDIFITQNLIKNSQPIQQPIQEQLQQPIQQPIQEQLQQPIQQPIQEQLQQPIQQPIQEQNLGQIIAIKQITKKTIKRKYTLGKSHTKRTIGLLIKDRGIRRQILSAQKDLKRKNINDIKIYLREHNLIKIGSNAPNDVLRKLYESAMLSGEITNSNVETLMHNYSKQDKEL